MNILTGSRDHLTKYLTEHQDVQVSSFTIMVNGTIHNYINIYTITKMTP